MEEKLTLKEIKRREELTDLKINFNSICIRELGLDYDEETNLVYEIDGKKILQYREKFMEYSEMYSPLLRPDRMEFNLLENCRLFDILFARYLDKYASRNGLTISSIYTTNIPASTRGYYAFTILQNGKSIEYASDPYVNESIRLLNLLTKINKSTHLYDFEKFDELFTKYKA